MAKPMFKTKSPSQRHPEQVIAQVCTLCKRLFRPDIIAGIFVGWFGTCPECSALENLDGGDMNLRDLGFDAGREAAIRAGDTGNTGLPHQAEGMQPSYSHKEYLAKVAEVWSHGRRRTWNKDLDTLRIR